MKCRDEVLDDIEARRPPHGGRGLKLPCEKALQNGCGRPPHGGRGLKLRGRGRDHRLKRVVPRTGDVD